MQDTEYRKLSLVIQTLILTVLLFTAAKLRSTPTWEYCVESVPDLNWDSGMSDLGQKGWEMVSARRATGVDDKASYEMIFKRRKR